MHTRAVDELEIQDKIDEAIEGAYNFTALPPKLAKGLVIAQAHATTVENDKESGGKGDFRFSYPSQAAITERAREALAAGKLALFSMGYEIDGGVMRVTYHLVHEDGDMGPAMPATMTVASMKHQDVGKSITYLRKYMMGLVLNMGWDDPKEDVDAHINAGQSAPKVTQRTTKPAPKSKPKPKEIEPDGLEEIRKTARQAVGILRGQFNFPDMDTIYKVATGHDAPWPKDPDMLEFMACVQLASVCEVAAEEDVPFTHKAFVGLCDQQEGPGYEPLFRDGEVTKEGRETRARWEANP